MVGRLFKNVSAELLNRPTYAAMLNLYNNYVAAAQTPETVTAQEIAEENAFIDAVFNTSVMRKTYQFLRARGTILYLICQINFNELGHIQIYPNGIVND